MFILQKVSACEGVQRHTSSRKVQQFFCLRIKYAFSKYDEKKFACILFASHKQWIWLGGKNLWQFCLFSSRLLSWHTPPHEVRDAPPCFTSAQVSQVHKWKCQNIRLVRAREVVNALQMQSIRRWIYFLAKGSFWPKTAKCRRELCTSNESSPLLYPWPTFKSWRTSHCHRHHHSSYLFSVSLSWSPTLSPLQISVWMSPTSSASMSSILPFFSSMQSLNNNIMWLRTK